MSEQNRFACRDEEGRARLMPGANLVDVIEALCRIMVIRRDAYEITNPVPRAKEHLAWQIFNGILPLIHYHFENDFGGNSRVRAMLRVLTGPGVAE